MTVTQQDREEAWNDLWKAAKLLREVLIEDNGGTTEVDLEDPFLAEMIGEMDRILHWDPDYQQS